MRKILDTTIRTPAMDVSPWVYLNEVPEGRLAARCKLPPDRRRKDWRLEDIRDVPVLMVFQRCCP